MDADNEEQVMRDFLEKFKVEKTSADGTRYDMYIIPLKNVRVPEIEKEMGNG